MRAKEKAEEAAIAAFLNAPTRHRRRQRLGQLSSESSALGLSASKEASSSDNSFDGFDLGEMMKAKRRRKKRMMMRRRRRRRRRRRGSIWL